jgi:hypothetical protein
MPVWIAQALDQISFVAAELRKASCFAKRPQLHNGALSQPAIRWGCCHAATIVAAAVIAPGVIVVVLVIVVVVVVVVVAVVVLLLVRG